MKTLAEIESAVKELAPDEFMRFRSWFLEQEAVRWDRQIEEDIFAGKLDDLADEALSDLRHGRTTGL